MRKPNDGKHRPKPTTSEQIDRELAASALDKRRRGQKPSGGELAALKRVERAREEEQRWAFYGSIPKKHWLAMSGRQTKVVNEQALRYGIPFGGRSIDLPAVVKAIHDFLASNARKLAAGDDDDPCLAGASSPALEMYRRERAKIARLDRLEREDELLPREVVHTFLGRLAPLLRDAGESLNREFGAEALATYNTMLDDVERAIETLVQPTTGDTDDRPPRASGPDN